MDSQRPLPVTVYTTGSSLASPATMLRDMLRDLIASRELAWRSAVRDISAQYRQTALGLLWVLGDADPHRAHECLTRRGT